MASIWVLTGVDEPKPLRAYRNKTRGEQDLELLRALESGGFDLTELPIFDDDARAPDHVSGSTSAAAPTRAPRELAADEILGLYHDEIPAGIDDLPNVLHEKYNARTLRAALNLAHLSRNKSAPERRDETGADANEAHPDLPSFLDRRGEKAGA